MASKTYTFDEVQQHRSTKSCWVVLYGHVYDVTSFLPSHPGGSKVILQLAGTDATEEYDPVHPPGTLEDNLPESAKLGAFDQSTLPKPKKETSDSSNSSPSTATTAASPQQQNRPVYPIKTLSDCLNLNDIEVLATSRMKKKAWAYYFSASDDLVSKSLNNQIYQRILLRPRIFVDCSRCDLSTTLLGPSNRVGVPFYVSPAAQARLGHPDGEAGIAAACARFGAAQVISNSASQTPEQICEAGAKSSKGEMVFGWQMYVQDDRSKSEAMLARVGKLRGKGMRFVVVTLDAPVPGKREDDERSSRVGADLPVPSKVAAEKEGEEEEEEGRAEPDAEGGVGRALFAGTAPDLTWKRTLPWLRQHTDLPIVLKGVQTHEDAYLASLYAPQIKAIILSNHGGRAMDTAPPAVHTLLEIRKFCPEVFSRVEVWVDGGIKRGTDVVKALCLGAKGVGIGRSPLYGLGAGGQKGVERVLEILKEETETAMRLLGVEKVEQLGLRHINTRAVEREIFDGTGAESLESMRSFVQSKL